MSIAIAETIGAAANDPETANAVADAVSKSDPGYLENLLKAVLGYAVVFVGLVLLMCVVIIVGKIMVAKMKKAPKETAAAPAAEQTAAVKSLPEAPGTAGEVKIYDTDPRDAAMIMAIVADKLQKPLNELRFVSIKEVK